MGEQMPIKWLRFEQSIAKLVEEGTYFASLDQVSNVLTKCFSPYICAQDIYSLSELILPHSGIWIQP